MKEEEATLKEMARRAKQAEEAEREIAAASVEAVREPVMKEVMSDPNLSPQQKEKMNIDTVNPEATKINAKKLQEEGSEQDTSLSENFKDALTFFAPQMIGGILGGIVEGDAGAVVGFQAGTGIRKQMSQYEQQQQIGRGRAFQQTDYETPEGRPVIIDPNTGRYISDGKPYQGRLVNTITKRQGRSLDRRDKEFGLRKAKEEEFSDKQTDQLKGLNQAENSLKRIRNLKSKVETGPMESRAKAVGEMFGATSPEFTQLRAEVENLKADYVRAISGAQASDREVSRLMAVVPDIMDQDQAFESKLDQFGKIMDSHKQDLLKAIKSGQPLKNETVKAILRTIDSKGGVPQPKAARKNITVNDIDNMSIEELKAAGLLD